jgi:hypothetical protein
VRPQKRRGSRIEEAAEIVIKKIKKSFDSFQNHFKNFSQVDWKVSHTNKVQKLLLF